MVKEIYFPGIGEIMDQSGCDRLVFMRDLPFKWIRSCLKIQAYRFDVYRIICLHDHDRAIVEIL